MKAGFKPQMSQAWHFGGDSDRGTAVVFASAVRWSGSSYGFTLAKLHLCHGFPVLPSQVLWLALPFPDLLFKAL